MSGALPKWMLIDVKLSNIKTKSTVELLAEINKHEWEWIHEKAQSYSLHCIHIMLLVLCYIFLFDTRNEVLILMLFFFFTFH